MKIDLETGRIKSKWLFREVRECEVYPRFYRFAWTEPHRDCKIAMLFPLNLITNWLRTAWIFVSWKLPIRQTARDKELRAQYNRGFDNGQRAGRAEVTKWVNADPLLKVRLREEEGSPQ